MRTGNTFTGIANAFELSLYFFCMVVIINKILCHKPKKKPLIFSSIVLGAISIIISISPFLFNTLLYYIVFIFTIIEFIFLKIIFPKQKTLNSILIYSSLNFVNILISSLISPSNWLLIPLPELIINTITLTTVIILCLRKTRFKIQQIVKLTPKYIFIIIIILLTISAFSSVLFLGAPLNEFEAQWNIISRIGLTITLVGVCLLLPVLLFNSVSSNHLKSVVSNYEEQINIQAEHYKKLAEANYEIRHFRHDFKNMSIALQALLQRDENIEALAILQDMGHSLDNPTQSKSLFDTGNGIADALLSDKQAVAEKLGAKICFSGVIPADFLSPTDLCVMLGNTLDNAIEACQKLPQNDVKIISVSCNCSSGFLFYSIKNPVCEKVEISGGYVATSKENEILHGFGLYSLNSIVKKYNGNINLSSTDNEFCVSIDLCLK